MANSFVTPLAIPKRAATVAASTALLLATAGVGANWLFTKQTPTGTSATRNIVCWKSGSGGGLCIREDGSVNASGSYLTNGVAAGGGGQVSAAKTANYTAVCNDLVVGDSRGGSFTVTLPAASTDCKISTLMKHNNNANTIYVKTPSASQLILDRWQASGGLIPVAARSFTGAIPLYGTGDTLGLHSDGTNWYIVSDTRIRHSASMKKPSTQSIAFSDTLVTLDHVTSDVGRLADTTNNRITIRRSGNYLITGECPFANTTGANQTNECQIWVNGAKIQANSGFENNSGVPIQPNVTYQMWLNKNDYVQLYANAVNTTNLGGANEWANLSVTEIR